MQRINPDMDIVMDILKAVTEAQPNSVFAQSLLQQYQQRGGLSKKQLEGLYGKASKVISIPESKLATLEAIIMKKHTKHRSPLPASKPLYEKDEKTGMLLDAVLSKFPQHKKALFLKVKYDNNELFSSTEQNELQQFYKIAVRKS